MIHARPQAPAGDLGTSEDAEAAQGAEALEALALSERFVLWNFRAWACCCRGRRLPAEPVVAAFANIGAPAAAEALDAAMTRLVLATGRPLAVHCPPHPGLSDDEATLLAAAAAAQRHDRDALTELFAGVLSPTASALVGRALMEFGAAIATVGVLLPQPGPQPRTQPKVQLESRPEARPGPRPGAPDRAWADAAPATLH